MSKEHFISQFAATHPLADKTTELSAGYRRDIRNCCPQSLLNLPSDEVTSS
jgi:hypothetical protein